MNRIIEASDAEIQRLQAARAGRADQRAQSGEARDAEEERGDEGEDGRGAEAPLRERESGEVTRPLRRCGHVDQSYLVTLKPPSRATQHVVASIVRVSGDHLIFNGCEGHASHAVSATPC
jgi:hypothetical protein